MLENAETELRRLNKESFQAEDEAKSEALETILADEFKLVRSTYVIEDKQTMLARVGSDKSGRTRHVDDENIRLYGDSALVTCRVTLKEPTGEVFGRFWNTKMFVKRAGHWRCLVWQVARIP